MTTYAPTNAPTDDESLDSLTSLGGFDGPRTYFGEITIIDDFNCVLERGRGKVPFDAGVHRPDQRLVALKIKVTCTKQDGTSYDLDQDDITSGSKHRVTLKSLQELGITSRAQLRGLVGKWVQVVRVETGRKFVAQKGQNAGQQVAETALKFLALYESEDACREAETAHYKRNASDGSSFGGATLKNAPQNIPADLAGVPSAAREALLQTLPALWMASQQSVQTFETILKGNPAYAQAGIDIWCDEATKLHGQLPF